MKRHDDSQRSDRLAVTQLILPPPPLFRTEKQLTLTARADRPVRGPAHTVAFTTAVAIGGARSVHRRTGMLAARVLPGDRNRPGSPPATNCAQNPPPALAAIQTHCCSDHRHAWRLDTRPARTPVNASPPPSRATAHDSGPPWVASPSTYDSSIHNTLPVCAGAQEARMILKEPHARAA